MKWIKVVSITCLAVITLSVMFFAFSPVLVGAISGVDNATAYSEALQAMAAGLQETLLKNVEGFQKLIDGNVLAFDHYLTKVLSAMEKAVAP